MFAAIRPDDWDFPLFLHVLGAMLLVGGLFAGGTALAIARGQARLQRLGYFSLLALALPGWIIMRAGAEWIYDKEFPDVDEDPTWVGIGYIVSDLGALLFLISLILAGVAVWKPKGWLSKTSGVLSVIILIGLVVAVWAMGAKPD